ncbi:MAG TPA: TIGR00645 family protein [Steroidobacteraceae bacterium]|jgi:uncharacterized protein (TIGR00645 family)|nr:TIGR00645 family protein [Steroidobacteraceae bacterium]
MITGLGRMTLRGLEIRFERLLFGARWILAPLYAGMVLALIAIVVVFARELIAQLGRLGTLDGEAAIVFALSLIDLSLTANLLVVVTFAGYESFVSQLHIGQHEDRPSWLGTIDFADLKLKVIASIVAISAIALLRSFLLLGDPATGVDATRLLWMVLIQLTFVVSGVLLALMDWITARADAHSASGHSGKLPR